MGSMLTRPHPRSYEEFAAGGWPEYIGRIVRSIGVPPHEAEDLTSDIVLHVLDVDALSHYRPERAAFSSYLRGYVVKRCRSWARDRRRQLGELVFNGPCGGTADEEPCTYEDLIGTDDPLFDTVITNMRLIQFEQWLDDLGESDLADLYGALVTQIACAPAVGGQATYYDMDGYSQLRWRLADDLGVRKSTVDRWMKRLKERIQEYGLLDA